jgi:glycosyltransferase involved in cell wall biosynthesis
MRIAVFHNLPPGGARRAAFELVRCAAAQHHFDLFTIDMGPSPSAAQDLGPLAKNVFSYALSRRVAGMTTGGGQLQRAAIAADLLRVHKLIASDIDAGGYDLAFVHHDQVLHAPAALRALRTPSVYYLQEPRRQSFEYTMMFRHRAAVGPRAVAVRGVASTFDVWFREIEIRATRSATVLVVNSVHSLESAYRAYGRYPVVSYLGVDSDVFTPSASRDHTGGRPGVVAVGALDRIKGHDLAIQAVGLVPARLRPPLTIVFERERPAVRDELAGMAQALEVDVTFRRGISDEELAATYRSSAATLCLASVEPFGLTPVESLASGTPVVAVREGGYREVVVDGENGLLVRRAPRLVAGAIEQVVAQPGRWTPAELRATVLPHFSWQAAGERINDVFEGVGHGDGDLVPRR